MAKPTLYDIVIKHAEKYLDNVSPAVDANDRHIELEEIKDSCAGFDVKYDDSLPRFFDYVVEDIRQRRTCDDFILKTEQLFTALVCQRTKLIGELKLDREQCDWHSLDVDQFWFRLESSERKRLAKLLLGYA